MLTWNNLSITAPTDNTNHFLRVAQLYGKELDILAGAPTPIINGQVSPTSPLWFIDLSQEQVSWQSPVPTAIVKRQNPVAWSEDKSKILIWSETTRRSPVNRGVIIPRYYVHDLLQGSTWEVWIGEQQRVPFGFEEGQRISRNLGSGRVILSGRFYDYPKLKQVGIFVATSESIAEIDFLISTEFNEFGRSPVYPVRFGWTDGERLIYAGQVQDKSFNERYPAVAYDGQIKVLQNDAARGIHGLSEDALLVRYDDRNTIWLFREDIELSIFEYLHWNAEPFLPLLDPYNYQWLDTTPYPLALRHDGAIVAIAPRQSDGTGIDMSEGFVWDRLVVD